MRISGTSGAFPLLDRRLLPTGDRDLDVSFLMRCLELDERLWGDAELDEYEFFGLKCERGELVLVVTRLAAVSSDGILPS